jgi:hypothetical protein
MEEKGRKTIRLTITNATDHETTSRLLLHSLSSRVQGYYESAGNMNVRFTMEEGRDMTSA